MRAALALAAASLAMACAPVSREQAERMCLEDARLAERPRGEVRLGVGHGVRRPGVDVEISSDFLLGRDPEQVWQTCVYRRSGEFPARTYRSLRN